MRSLLLCRLLDRRSRIFYCKDENCQKAREIELKDKGKVGGRSKKRMVTRDVSCNECGFEGKIEAHDTVGVYPDEILFKALGKDPDGYIHLECPRCQFDFRVSSFGFFRSKITGVSRQRSAFLSVIIGLIMIIGSIFMAKIGVHFISSLSHIVSQRDEKAKGQYESMLPRWEKAIAIGEAHKKSRALEEPTPEEKLLQIAEQNWTKGAEYAAQGKFKEAKGEFEKALKIDPLYGAAKRALKVIEDVTDQKIKSNTAIHLFKGAAYAFKGQLNEAITEFSKTIEISPRFAYAYLGRGTAYAYKYQFDQAISDYSKAIEMNPRDADAYFLRGFAYFKKGQYDQAISDFNKAIELKPKFAEVYNNRAVAYFFKREYDKAWDDVYKAQNLGFQIHPRFLKDLREASGRER